MFLNEINYFKVRYCQHILNLLQSQLKMGYKTTLDFLRQLKKNNNREWFTKNKPKFVTTREDFEAIVQLLLNGISKFDQRLENTTPKDCIYRIYRDVRFGKDKTPYKTNFGAVMAEGGRKSDKAFYYIQVEPGGNTFVAGGLYMPQGELLKKIRQEIDYNAKAFTKILNKKSFKDNFPEMEGEKLKKAPKGYAPDDPNIELLKHKSFIVVHRFADKEVLADDFNKNCIRLFKEMKPFNDFLNTAIS